MSLPAPSEIAAALIAREEMPPERGEQGPIGKAGEFGPPGPQGAKGDPGRNGQNGSNGDLGPVGPQGNGGPRGLKGDKGDKGDQGEIGIQGPRGETGAVGSGRALFPRPGGGGSGGAPSGAAGGDLSGTYPNPSVVNDSHSHTGATLPTAAAADLAAVLAEGNDTGENTIEMPLGTIDGTVAFGTVSIKASDDGNDFGAELNLNPAATDTPGDIYLYGGGGDAGNPGGGVILQGGSSNGGPGIPASIVASGGTGAGNPGKVALTTDGSTGAAGDFLGSDGSGNVTWQDLVTYLQAYFVELS